MRLRHRVFIISLFLFLVAGFPGIVLCEPLKAGPGVNFITRYVTSSEHTEVFGLFELGNKPSIRIVTPTDGGKIRFHVHARHYIVPVNKPFRVWLAYEDVTGRVFIESRKISFDGSRGSSQPVWFKYLEGLVGMTGDQVVELDIPKGTSVINFLGEYEGISPSPNQLLGYISQIELPRETTP